MNPFNITKAELNIEKIDFLKNLILLIWKGSDNKISELEFRIVEQIVTDYYDAYFHGFGGYDLLITNFDFDSMWFYSLKVVPLEPDNYQVTYQAGKYTHQINIQVAYRDGRYWINAITGVR